MITRRTITLTVKLTVDDTIEGRVTSRDAVKHVRDAVAHWGGSLSPDNWQWPEYIKVVVTKEN